MFGWRSQNVRLRSGFRGFSGGLSAGPGRRAAACRRAEAAAEGRRAEAEAVAAEDHRPDRAPAQRRRRQHDHVDAPVALAALDRLIRRERLVLTAGRGLDPDAAQPAQGARHRGGPPGGERIVDRRLTGGVGVANHHYVHGARRELSEHVPELREQRPVARLEGRVVDGEGVQADRGRFLDGRDLALGAPRRGDLLRPRQRRRERLPGEPPPTAPGERATDRGVPRRPLQREHALARGGGSARSAGAAPPSRARVAPRPGSRARSFTASLAPAASHGQEAKGQIVGNLQARVRRTAAAKGRAACRSPSGGRRDPDPAHAPAVFLDHRLDLLGRPRRRPPDGSGSSTISSMRAVRPPTDSGLKLSCSG